MKSIFKRLLNVEDMMVGDVSLDDSPLRDAPVLVARVRCGKGALRCSRCGRKAPGYDNGGGGRSWRHQDFGCFRVELSGPVPRVECRLRGVVVSRVPWAEPGGRFTRDFGSECAWLMTVAGQKTVSGFLHIAWRTAGDIARRVARPAGVLDAVHVRRVARDRCGRDRPQEGPRVHHRHRRPRARTRDLGARRARQTGPRPVLPTTDAGAARVDPDRDRRRGRTDRLVRGRAPPERRTRARPVPHRLLDDRRARPGRETVAEPGQARREHNGGRGDARRRIRRAREPRRPDRTPIHGPRHTRRRGSQGPATARGSSGNSCARSRASPSNGPKRNSNDGSAGRPAAASPRSSNHAGRSADAATTSSQPSGSAVPTPGSKRSTTRSRSPSAWPTASATRTTSSP